MLIKNLAEANDIIYLHFLQPNQYVEGSKPFNEAEMKIAYNKDHRFREGVVKGYPLLQEMGQQLRKERLNFYDLSMVFSETVDPLHADDCCHLVPTGYVIIAQTIANKIIQLGQ